MSLARPYSYLTHLECSRCAARRTANQLQSFCPDCQAPLLARYDLAAASGALRREDFATRPRGMWRWHELLPVQTGEDVLSLGEGDTPVLRLPRRPHCGGNASGWTP